ncbi:hypothetical protein ACH4VS_37840 [Streptomyces hygroscopicus]|uniref:maltokinase N-terminal cap-like domain-containing protein n=1 Tax=Streptomyces hygroscopicus TaxID=1912 RepID=UPI00099E469F|nr:hypothetical protein [Streptomyces hygroscopicus]GLV79353.1 aminoglycoside phosphotransferase [Streptomyces hygroscopicus subsp. hygroscopicus]
MTALPLSVAAMLRSTEVGRGLATWLPKQRWFAGGSAPLTEVSVHGVHRFASSAPDAASTGAFVLVRARDGGGADEATYLVPLGVRDAAGAPAGDGVVAHVGALAVYDALDDPALVNALIRHTVQGRAMDGVRYRPESGVGAPPGTDLAVRPLGTEQSNSSVVAGEEYILKLFRRPGSGPSTDLTVHRLLRDAGSPHVTPLLGAVEDAATGATFATIQRYLPDATDGWAFAVAAAQGDGDPSHRDFPEQIRHLGAAVAAVHRDLAGSGGRVVMGPDDYLRMSEGFLRRLERALKQCAQLEPLAAPLRETFASVAALRPAEAGIAHPIHGDLHLGQTLRTGTGWLLLDFEGEPLADPAERAGRHSPLRDVAGMLRSFDYAAHQAAAEQPAPDGVEEDRARCWALRTRREFLQGYTAGRPLDSGPRALLRACELDKAVYEVLYETQHRPLWAWIPLGALQQELAAAPG